MPGAPALGSTRLSYPAAAELIRRAARITRQDAYSRPHGDERRSELAAAARALDALAANIDAVSGDVTRFEYAIRRAIEMTLADLDPQLDEGIPREAQVINYASILAAVRGELADMETP